MRERKGYVFQEKGKWYARVTVTDDTGRRRNIKKTAGSKVEANKLLRYLNTELDIPKDLPPKEHKRRTFNDLADYYMDVHAIPARFVDGHKVEGMKGAAIIGYYIKTFRSYFGSMLLSQINHTHLVSFRDARISRKTYKGTARTITTVNRELANLRRILSVAVENGWIAKNPFKCGPSLISTACEKRRERILSYEEEYELLEACNIPRRQHLRFLLIVLLDTGARKGEVLKLRWSDVDLINRLLTIRPENSKTLKERSVGMTERLYRELSTRKVDVIDSSIPVFPFKNVRSVFESACKEVGIKHGGLDGLTLHCLRHTAATRLVKGQLPIQLVGRILGHTQVNTTYRYLSADTETVRRAAEILENQRIAICSS